MPILAPETRQPPIVSHLCSPFDCAFSDSSQNIFDLMSPLSKWQLSSSGVPPLRQKSPSFNQTRVIFSCSRWTHVVMASKFHYHIRWLPSDLLDWKPFSNAKSADRRAKQLVGKDETFTIERFPASCRRCVSREYSEPTEGSMRHEFIN